MAVHAEVDFSGFPFLAELDEECTDQAQEGCLVGEQACDPGAAFEFHVQALQCVGGPEATLMGHGEAEHGEALREVFLHPSGQLGSGGSVFVDDFLETPLGGVEIGAVEDGADGVGDGGPLVEPGHVGLGVLLEVELAALPRHRWEEGLSGGTQPGVIVADDQLDPLEAPFLERGEEGSPVDLRLAEGGTDAEDGAFAALIDADGDKDGTVDDTSTLTDLLVSGIEEEVGVEAQGAGAPGVQFGVELGGTATDLGGTDRGPTQLLDDGGDFASGDALDVHLCQGEFEGLFAAYALVQGAGVEAGTSTDLRDVEGDGTDPCVDGLGLVAVAVAIAGLGALIGLGVEDLGAFVAHGFVDEQADALGEAFGAVFVDELQEAIEEFRLGLVGHVRRLLDVFGTTPTGSQHGPPSTSF